MPRARFVVERNKVEGHPKEQRWRLWYVDEFDIWWSWGFAETRAKCELEAKRERAAKRSA